VKPLLFSVPREGEGKRKVEWRRKRRRERRRTEGKGWKDRGGQWGIGEDGKGEVKGKEGELMGEGFCLG